MSENKQTVGCPNCGTENVFDSSYQDKLYCQECGKDLTKYVITENNTFNTETMPEQANLENSNIENVSEKETDKEYKICPNCENECGCDDTFCNKCGQKLNIETKCPNCGADFSEEDFFCKKCGTKLPKLPQKEIVKKLYCPTCGNEYKKGDTFCGECGTNLQTAKAYKSDNIQMTENRNVRTISKQQTATYSSKTADTVKCPYCGNNVRRYIKKCPHCGEWLSGVSHFGCGSFMMLITTILAVFMAIGGEGIGIPLVGEIGGIWLVIVAFLYFLPALISDWRGHDSKLAIFVVNLLFGWTFIGWFAALIFAFTGRSR